MSATKFVYKTVATHVRRAKVELHKLIRLLVDSEKGFAELASSIQHTAIAELFRSLASERSKMATELLGIVNDCCDDAPRVGKMATSIHQTWPDLQIGMSEYDLSAILAEAERREDRIKSEYERAMAMVWGDKIHCTLSMHFLVIQAARDRLRELHDSFG